MNIKQELKTLFYISFLLFVLLFIFNNFKQENLPNIEKNTFEIKNLEEESDNKKLQEIVENTTAEGVIVYDNLNNKILASKNIEKKYSLASLTKIITSVIVYEKDENLLNEIREMMKTSNNEDAENLALNFGKNNYEQVEYMNNFTQRFGYFNFRNVSGLDLILVENTDKRLAGGESDMLSLLSFIKEYYFKYPEIFDQTIILENNTNYKVDQLSFLNASKTGFTSLSGGNLFVSFQKGLNRQIFIIVLNSTEKNRFVDVQNIANFLLQSSI